MSVLQFTCRWAGAVLTVMLIAACASIHADRFYVLAAAPAPNAYSQDRPSQLTTLRVTIPAMADRNEMVLSTANGVKILEHERWAAPLTDQITTVLGQDLEHLRNDLLITTGRTSGGDAAKIAIGVDIVDIQAHLGTGVMLEARWRVAAPDGKASVGRDSFNCASHGGDYRNIVDALSSCVAQLASRLITAM